MQQLFAVIRWDGDFYDAVHGGFSVKQAGRPR